VIIGYDARHKSSLFATDSAEILAAAGFQQLLTDRPTPTPVVAFGIKHFGCVAGVVVTASHNPGRDNGYKVYLGDGSQIVPPTDGEIAARIDEIAATPLSSVPRSQDYQLVGPELAGGYLDRAAALVAPDTPRELSWVFTPMHGVGKPVVEELISRTGFSAPIVVQEQAEPDPDFPTVPFPNPEEPGALDLAIATAERADAELVIANDPDADRCAVAVPGPAGWRMLRGDELGVLLADDALRRGVQGTYACSIVSGTLLRTLAADHDQPFRSTLTGFKWIGRVPDLAFGYEEAIGYCVDPGAVADKDGITALLRVLALAATLRAQGRTLSDRLDDLALQYGVCETDQLTVRVDDPAVITGMMDRLRADPPMTLAGQPVVVRDLDQGIDLGPDGVLPPTDGVLFAGESIKVVARPSGTEPKLKCYLEARVPTDDRPLDVARHEAAELLAVLRRQLSAALGVS
jgi:phosphomannomutase